MCPTATSVTSGAKFKYYKVQKVQDWNSVYIVSTTKHNSDATGDDGFLRIGTPTALTGNSGKHYIAMTYTYHPSQTQVNSENGEWNKKIYHDTNIAVGVPTGENWQAS